MEHSANQSQSQTMISAVTDTLSRTQLHPTVLACNKVHPLSEQKPRNWRWQFKNKKCKAL